MSWTARTFFTLAPQLVRLTIASESKDESGEAVSRARPSAKEIERVLAADKA